MENDKKVPDEYPKLSENDKRWKQQDEFDSAGAQRQQEDEDANAAIAESTDNPSSNEEKATSDKEAESTRRDREQL